nr:glycerate-2-kinase family protein [Lachnospiraceae bacterium]
MNQKLREDANRIIEDAIFAVKPEEAVKRALKDVTLSGNVYLVSVGKAAYTMAEAASQIVEYKKGVVVTKYHHVFGKIPRVECFEAAHPTPDEAGVLATQQVLQMVSHLKKEDTVLFLLSGGGSALFEDPIIPLEELQDITNQLLAKGADITEMNAIRKRLSKVKGGKFAKAIAPAKVYSVILSDVLGDPVDMIASGPTAVDASTCEEVEKIIETYDLKLSDVAKKA